MESAIGPSRRLKAFFWIILGVYSVFFAEVVSGSDVFPFFHAWGLLVVFPLYALHMLVLSHVVFRYGKPLLSVLFSAGAIFGLYEAYMTKVLWDPPWGDPVVSIGGMAIVEFIVLVLFWHPVMSFIIPLVAAEALLSRPSGVFTGLPAIVRLPLSRGRMRIWLLVLGALFGVLHSAGLADPFVSVQSSLSTTGVLAILTYLWRKGTTGPRFDMQNLVPDKREFLLLLGFLIVMYVILGIILRPEALPNLGSQLGIWVAYVLLGFLLIRNLRRSNKNPSESESISLKISMRDFTALTIVFVISSAGATVVLGVQNAVLLVLWVVGGIIGIMLLLKSIKG
ncbi:MAG: hypothetical protein HY619_02385 [Thaumarchaeota archaeon]|nr:hypothetical protein [Nitrososphaerota archaeon]